MGRSHSTYDPGACLEPRRDQIVMHWHHAICDGFSMALVFTRLVQKEDGTEVAGSRRGCSSPLAS